MAQLIKLKLSMKVKLFFNHSKKLGTNKFFINICGLFRYQLSNLFIFIYLNQQFITIVYGPLQFVGVFLYFCQFIWQNKSCKNLFLHNINLMLSHLWNVHMHWIFISQQCCWMSSRDVWLIF